MNPIAERDGLSLVGLLQETALFLWKDWPRDMKLSSVTSAEFVLNGTCPHCGKQAAFPTVTNLFEENPGKLYSRVVGVVRCIACSEFIVGILKRQPNTGGGSFWAYEAHYPLGKPSDGVNEDVPEGPRLDFSEAIRCRWVNAYNATIEMCRRCLESSCIELGADSKLVLNDMINWVHKQGKITAPLLDMAHKIKLGGNRAAHPSDRTLTAQDADAVVEFTSSYLYNVYIMPAKMAKFNFDKPPKGK
jgi:hypothetical protein